MTNSKKNINMPFCSCIKNIPMQNTKSSHAEYRQISFKITDSSVVFQNINTARVQVYCYLKRNIFLPIPTNLIMSSTSCFFLKHPSAMGWFL